MDIKIANRLQELRKKNGYSQEELADELGVSRQAVSKWERGDASPDTDNLIALSKIYNVTLDELINGQDEYKINENEYEDFKKEQYSKYVKSDDEEDDDDDKNLTPTQKLVITIVSGVSTIVALTAYLVLGFCFNLWHPAWIVFMLIPFASSLADAIVKKNPTHFAYPVIVVVIYLLVGFLTDLWHPCWAIFLTIPIYYLIIDVVSNVRRIKTEKKP